MKCRSGRSRCETKYFPLASAILRLIKQNDGPNDGSLSLSLWNLTEQLKRNLDELRWNYGIRSYVYNFKFVRFGIIDLPSPKLSFRGINQLFDQKRVCSFSSKRKSNSFSQMRVTRVFFLKQNVVDIAIFASKLVNKFIAISRASLPFFNGIYIFSNSYLYKPLRIFSNRFFKFHWSSTDDRRILFHFDIYNSCNIFPLSFISLENGTILDIILSRANFSLLGREREYLRDIRFFAVTPITRVINRTVLITRCDGGKKKKKKDRITRRWMENEHDIDRRLSDDENRMGRMREESLVLEREENSKE